MLQLGLAVAISLSNAAAPPTHDYTLNRTTRRSVREFAECFVAAQGAAGNAWWFVPNDRGGVLSNDGAATVGNSYRVNLLDEGRVRSLRLEPAAPSRPPEPPVAAAIEHCL